MNQRAAGDAEALGQLAHEALLGRRRDAQHVALIARRHERFESLDHGAPAADPLERGDPISQRYACGRGRLANVQDHLRDGQAVRERGVEDVGDEIAGAEDDDLRNHAGSIANGRETLSELAVDGGQAVRERLLGFSPTKGTKRSLLRFRSRLGEVTVAASHRSPSSSSSRSSPRRCWACRSPADAVPREAGPARPPAHGQRSRSTSGADPRPRRRGTAPHPAIGG